MKLINLSPQLQKLNRVEKRHVIQLPASELAQEKGDLIQPHGGYPVWSPYHAVEAAHIMLQVLKESNP